LATSGTANTFLPNGWDLAETGTSTRNNGAYAASTGSDNAGDVYSFGASASIERAYGCRGQKLRPCARPADSQWAAKTSQRL
jgi:hypothetical protein